MPRAVVRVASLALSGVLVLALAGLGVAVSQVHAPGPAAADTTLVLARGLNLGAIAGRLESQGVIANAPIFSLWVRVSGAASRLRAGEYRFPAHVAGVDVARMLTEGRTLKHKLTVPAGLTTPNVLALLANAEALQGEVPREVAEGALMPETYQYEWGDTRAALVARMERGMADLVAELWAKRDLEVALTTAAQAVTLASIIERETARADERPRVAAVFLNRLRMGMRLQSDPTVAYALAQMGRPEAPLTRDDLDIDHPFNTYRVRGLPPGPIANPGRASLVAVLHPIASNDLYFVADGTGGHAFAATLEEHNRNVARLRALRGD